MSSFPLIFRKKRSERRTHNSLAMSKSYTQISNTSTRRSSLTSTCSRTSTPSSLWSNSSSGISSLDVSLVQDTPHNMQKWRQDKPTKDEGEIGEVRVMVGKEIINLRELTLPQISGRGLISSEMMSCVANHTKLLEGVAREVRAELTSYHQQTVSRKVNPRKQAKLNRQDAIMLENLNSSCAETLKHIKNLYDQTRYLKGVINMIDNDLERDPYRTQSIISKRNPSSYFYKINGCLLGCITIILLGFKTKLVYGNITIPDVFSNLSYYANLWTTTLLQLLEKPSNFQMQTIHLELT